jgi:hypothetical protein
MFIVDVIGTNRLWEDLGKIRMPRPGLRRAAGESNRLTRISPLAGKKVPGAGSLIAA